MHVSHLLILYMIPFNYHHLFYFYTIAKTGSISKACNELNLAQPTLSAQLKQFEQHLKIKLFLREKNKLILTEEGRNILFYATEIFDIGREMIGGLRDQSVKGRLKIKIGVSSYIPRTIVIELLNFLIKIDPEIYISIHEDSTTSLINGLKTHQLDAALSDMLTLSHTQESIEHRLVAQIPIVFCANQTLAKKYKHLPEALNNAPMILPTTHSQVYQAVQDYFISHNIKPKIVAEIQDVELVRRLVLSGVGIAPLNQLTVTQAPSRKPLVILNKKEKPSIWEKVYVLTKTRKKNHPLIPKILEQFRITS